MAVNPVPARGLTRSEAGTLYAQLYNSLLSQIRDGVYAPGERLPTEAELGELYGVSRMTVRRALDELRRVGLVERKPALGTFVAEPPLSARISGLHSLTDEILQLGMTPGSTLLAREDVPASAEVATQLSLSEGATVLRLDRVRTADGRPFYVASSFLNTVVFPELASQDYSSATLSLLATYRRVLGFEVERMTQFLSATAAPQLAREVFGLAAGSPVLLFERVVYLGGNRPVEYVRAYFRGDSYKFYSELV